MRSFSPFGPLGHGLNRCHGCVSPKERFGVIALGTKFPFGVRQQKGRFSNCGKEMSIETACCTIGLRANGTFCLRAHLVVACRVTCFQKYSGIERGFFLTDAAVASPTTSCSRFLSPLRRHLCPVLRFRYTAAPVRLTYGVRLVINLNFTIDNAKAQK